MHTQNYINKGNLPGKSAANYIQSLPFGIFLEGFTFFFLQDLGLYVLSRVRVLVSIHSTDSSFEKTSLERLSLTSSVF